MTSTFEELLAQHCGLLKLEVQRFLDRFGRNERLEWNDAYQIAQLTLWKCMAKFDPERHTKFSTYLGSALRRNLSSHARSTLPKVRCGPNSNGWRTIPVVSWDALAPAVQERVLQGYIIPDEADEAA
jgi:DNA-directed RNA polymerase specialized sigma24 family protein